MLFLYLPFIIIEAWMFSPRKRNIGDRRAIHEALRKRAL